MGFVALLLLGTALFIFLFGILIVKYAEFALRILVERKHLEAEHIMSCGEVPPRWTRGWARLKALAPLARLRARKRLQAIISYFRVTPMVEDDQTRKRLIDRLSAILETWRESGWSEMVNSR